MVSSSASSFTVGGFYVLEVIAFARQSDSSRFFRQKSSRHLVGFRLLPSYKERAPRQLLQIHGENNPVALVDQACFWQLAAINEVAQGKEARTFLIGRKSARTPPHLARPFPTTLHP